MRAIITRVLYNFYPVFHCGSYCRVVYPAFFVVHMYYITAVYSAKLFVLEETFLSLKIHGL